MKQFFLFLVATILFVSCAKNESKSEIPKSTPKTFGIVIHGGAGTILKKNMSDSLEIAYKNKLKEAITIGHTILAKGGTSIDAITATINVMENSPLFNAGKGSVFANDETNQLDASIMDGSTLNAGAVAGVSNVKNPINLALSVMNDSPHVLLSGKGAETFATEQGIEQVDPSYFYTERRFNSLKRVKEKVKKSKIKEVAFMDPFIKKF